MQKMDEMSKHIRLRSEEYGFKFILLALSIWILWECYSALSTGQRFNILPTLILTGGLAVQGFSEIIMKRKMIAGDDEYREPNQILLGIVLSVATIAIIVSVGFYILHS